MVSLGAIVRDERAQSRAGTDDAAVAEYAEAMAAGAVFPPLVVFEENGQFWLSEGFHRYAALTAAGFAEAPCDVRPGGLRDAILHSVGANATHGVRRTNADKRRAVAILLKDDLVSIDPETSKPWSNREIARRCAVSADMVDRLRPIICPSQADAPRTVSRGGKVYTMDTGRIGRHAAEPPADVPPALESDPAPAPLAPVINLTDALARQFRREADHLRVAAEPSRPTMAPIYCLRLDLG